MSDQFPSPTLPVRSRTEVLLGYLEYFRARVLAKVQRLPEAELRQSRLPSGWTPLELVNHLTYVELRWLQWGFEGRQVSDPWGDNRDERWYVVPEESVEDVAAARRAQEALSRTIVEANDLGAVGPPGPRWDDAEPATLERILLHLIQEYARHLGHLDIIAELADGAVGE